MGLFWLNPKPEELFVVGQNISGKDNNRKELVYRLSDDMNSLHSTNKTVRQFFGCPQLNPSTVTETAIPEKTTQLDLNSAKEWLPLWAKILILIVIVVLFVSAVIAIWTVVYMNLRQTAKTQSINQSFSTVKTLDSNTGEAIQKKKISPKKTAKRSKSPKK